MTRTIVCWGELVWDLFPDGRRLGGTSANVAYHLAVLGHRARLVSRVGDDEPGRAARATLEARGVDVSLVQTDAERPTGSVRVEFVGNEPRFAVTERAAWDRVAFDDAVRDAVLSADALVYGTLAQRTVLGRGAIVDALAAAPRGCFKLCDLNVRPPFVTQEIVEEALAQANAVKLNEHEAELVARIAGTDDVVAWLLDRGIELCALTRGEHGALLATPGERVDHGGVQVDTSAGDAVGAGDAFTAAIAHLWPQRIPLAELAERANRYAAFVASRPGAMPDVPAAVRDAVG